ncbi:MAG: NAD(P)-dependent oxidoreductase [Novosphingobium sp.]|nr:NAD(P)-dependent oxidoreductase [Novosphingobium sp.]
MEERNTPPRFVLTGPSGWIGSAVLANFAQRFGPPAGQISAFGSKPSELTIPDGSVLPVRALETITPQDVAGAHVIHLAYLTREKASEVGERAFTDANIAIDDALLGAITRAKPASLFIASSGAAAHAASGQDRHPYGVCKLRQEARFLDWAAGHGVPTIAGRIFNIAGPWINKHQAYAVSDFALQAMNGGPIEIKANRPVFRSFLHVDDLCNLIFSAALGRIGRTAPIDLCGAEVLEMMDIASEVSAQCKLSTTMNRPKLDLTAPSVYLGNHVDTKILAIETGTKLTSFSVQIADTLRWIKTKQTPSSRQSGSECMSGSL